MCRQSKLQSCDQQVARLSPSLPRPEQKALAQFVDGVVRSGSILLAQAADAAPGPQTAVAKARRFQRLLANDRFVAIDDEDAYLVALLSGRRGRLPLYIDCTTTQVEADGRGVITLMLAVTVHDRAQPLLWHSWAPGTASAQVMAQLDTLCERLRHVLPPNLTPVLIADRGFGGSALVAIAQRLGWHVLVRVQKNTRIRGGDGQVRPMHELVAAPGDVVALRDVQVYGPKANGHAGPWATWDTAPTVQVLISQPAAPARANDPWCLITDLPPTRTRTDDYCHRTRIEELFRDLKSMGWQWQRSRIRDPRRIERQLSVLALATWWVTALGTLVIKRGWRTRLEPARVRRLSRFRLGWRWLHHCQAHHLPIPVFLPGALPSPQN